MRTVCWAIQDKRSRYLNQTGRHGYKIMTFQTRREALEWIETSTFWKGMGAIPVKINIITREV